MPRYLVSNNPCLIEYSSSDTYQMLTVSESLNMLYKEKILGLDTETTGLCPHADSMTLCQFGTSEFQIVIDTLTIDIRFYEKLLTSDDIMYILHNAKFDIQFFYKYKIVLKRIFDTYIAEKLLYLGYPKGYRRYSLAVLCENYLGVTLDKSERKNIHKKITDKSIIYGANDVKYLIPLFKELTTCLTDKDLITACKFENSFVKVLAYTEFCGLRLDRDKWQARIDRNKKALKECGDDLDKWILNYGNPKYLNLQIDLFHQSDDPRANINWNSPKQVIPLFEELGFNLESINKKTKKLTKSVGGPLIEKQENISTIAPLYVRYKKIQKDLSSFGQNYLDEINPITQKIHSNFNQLVDTTRLSSGSDEDEDIETVNIQNVPANKDTRECFIAEEGDYLIDVDYHAQEDFIFTEMSREPKLIEFYNDKANKRDGHGFVAKMCFPHILENVPELEVAEKFPKLRSEAKKAKFSLHYGGNGATVAKNLGLTDEEGFAIEKSYLTGFPGIKAYFDKVFNETLRNGYILLNPRLRHKRFIHNFDEFRELQRRLNTDFWNEYREEKAKDSFKFQNDLKPAVKRYFKIRETIKKNSYNSPVQGTASMMTKLAAMYLFRELERNGLLFKVKIHNLVHDEILVGAPKEIADSTAKLTQDCMELASKYFVTVVTMGAKPLIGEHWVH